MNKVFRAWSKPSYVIRRFCLPLIIVLLLQPFLTVPHFAQTPKGKQGLPEGVTLIPGNEWESQGGNPPPNGKMVIYDAYDQPKRVWGCTSTPTGRTQCQYIDSITVPPPDVVPPEGYVWACIESPLIFAFQTPHWSCGWFRVDEDGNPIHSDAFVPSPSDVAAARVFRESLADAALGYAYTPPCPAGGGSGCKEVPQQQQRLTNEDKKKEIHRGQTQQAIGFVSGAAGTVLAGALIAGGTATCAATVVCGLVAVGFLAIGTAAVYEGGKTTANASIDPPDPNYTDIIQPVKPTLSIFPMTTESGLEQETVDAFNALADNILMSIGLQSAIMVSLDRAEGAKLASNAEWEAKQVDAANQYAQQLADLLEKRPQHLADLEQVISRHGITVSLAEESVDDFQNKIRTEGMPATMQTVFAELQAQDPSSFTGGRAGLILVNPEEVVALGEGTFPQALTDPDLISAINDGIAANRSGYVFGLEKVYMPVVLRTTVQQRNGW